MIRISTSKYNDFIKCDYEANSVLKHPNKTHLSHRTWYSASSTDVRIPKLTIVFDKVRPM